MRIGTSESNLALDSKDHWSLNSLKGMCGKFLSLALGIWVSYGFLGGPSPFGFQFQDVLLARSGRRQGVRWLYKGMGVLPTHPSNCCSPILQFASRQTRLQARES